MGPQRYHQVLGRELVMRKVHIRAAFGRAYAVAPISASMWVGTFTSIALFMRRTARQGVAGRVDRSGMAPGLCKRGSDL